MGETRIEALERRVQLDADPNVYVDLSVDADRDGRIDATRDRAGEDRWTAGAGGRGAIILPNVDRDNDDATGAPDNWTGGAFDGRAVAPNNMIDNDADVADVGRVRLRKLRTDASYEYSVVVRVARPASDPAWYRDADAADRVRLFLPTRRTAAGGTVPRAGDVAVIGPGLGDAIRFTPNPTGAGDYDINLIAGDGTFEFGIEGLAPGANVRVEAELFYQPIGTDGPPPDAVSAGRDRVEIKVAPFVLNDNRQRVTRAAVDDLTPYSIDNAAVQATLKRVFGERLITSRAGDFWQQDGYEVGHVAAPYGAMTAVLELPRARDRYFSVTDSFRSFVRGTLLGPGTGVLTDVAALTAGISSSYGGDVEALAPLDGDGPAKLLVSGMPADMRSFFAAQGYAGSRVVDLSLDWLAVNHVDEVVQQTPGGKVIVADPDAAWALLTWARRLDPDVRLHAGMNGNEAIAGYTDAGLRADVMLADARLRSQNLDLAQRSSSLRGVVDQVSAALGLKGELTAPARTAGNGTARLARGGAFAQMIDGDAARQFAIRFDDATSYRLRYRDDAGAWSRWWGGRTDRDEVFASARAFVLKEYWSGTPRAGDAFKFATRPDATLLKMPVMFASPALLNDPEYVPEDPRLLPFSEDHVNALVDGPTVVTGEARGPVVRWAGDAPATDLFQAYAGRVFAAGGYARVVTTDARVYHNSSGSVHCATNALRALPDRDWWTAVV